MPANAFCCTMAGSQAKRLRSLVDFLALLYFNWNACNKSVSARACAASAPARLATICHTWEKKHNRWKLSQVFVGPSLAAPWNPLSHAQSTQTVWICAATDAHCVVSWVDASSEVPTALPPAACRFCSWWSPQGSCCPRSSSRVTWKGGTGIAPFPSFSDVDNLESTFLNFDLVWFCMIRIYSDESQQKGHCLRLMCNANGHTRSKVCGVLILEGYIIIIVWRGEVTLEEGAKAGDSVSCQYNSNR